MSPLAFRIVISGSKILTDLVFGMLLLAAPFIRIIVSGRKILIDLAFEMRHILGSIF